MADSTVNYAWPFPTGGDKVAVSADIAKVAQAVDATMLQTASRVTGAESRVAALENPPTRRAGVPLTFSRGTGTDTRAIVTVRIPVKFGAPVKRIRVAFRNYDYRSGTPYPGAMTINGVAFGEHQMNADGSMTGLFPTAPTIVSGPLAGPADAATFSTGWVTVNAEAGKEYLLAYTVNDGGLTKSYQLGYCFTSGISGGWQSVGPTTAVPQLFAPLAVNLEVELDASTPVYAYLGDSMTAGQGASKPGYDSWANQHARSHGAIAQIYAEPGSSLPQWEDPMDPAWRRFQHLAKPDRLYSLLGYNDLGNTVTLATMQARLNTTLTTALGFTQPNLYLATILPRPEVGPSHEAQLAFNDWLSSTLPNGAKACLDFYRAVVDPATETTDPMWRTSPGDGHLSTAGYARLAETSTLPAPTVGPEPVSVTYAGDGVYEIG